MPLPIPTPSTPISHLFTQLTGTWHLRRTLTSALPGFPTGTFTGTATFAPRQPSSDTTSAELLYSEQGELLMANGLKLQARKRYVYRYSAEQDLISAWFVKEGGSGGKAAGPGTGASESKTKGVKGSSNDQSSSDDGAVAPTDADADEVDYHFHDVEMRAEGGAWTGRGEHLCSRDMYWAYYEFRVSSGDEMEEEVERPRLDVFGLRYKVKGPEKDYMSDAAFQRV